MLNKILDKKKLIVYYAWVESILRYGLEVYGTAFNTDIDRVQKIQNKVVKTLFRKNGMINNDDMYKKLGILKIRKLRDFITTLNNYYKPEFKKTCLIKSNLLRQSTYRYNVMHPRNEFGKRNRNYRIPMLFNLLPNNVMMGCRIAEVKKLLKAFYLG